MMTLMLAIEIIRASQCILIQNELNPVVSWHGDNDNDDRDDESMGDEHDQNDHNTF